MLLLLWAALARAADGDPPPADPELEALLRDAEAASSPPPPAPQAPARAAVNALNPGLTAFGDLVGQLGASPGGVAPGSTVYLRSLELELRADVDPFAKASAVVAFEQEAPPLEGGPSEGFGAEPEEAYVDLVALPARLSLRAGKFKAPFGLVNRTHPHDLPWTDVPPALGALGEEGFTEAGVSLGWILPLGPAALTLTGGAFSGEIFDPDGERANVATLGRAELFVGAGPVDVALGGSAVRDLGQGASDLVVGGDFTLRWRPSRRQSVVLLGEVFRGVDGEHGGYAAVQLQPARMVYVGLREDIGEELVHNAFVSFYTSEFLRVRVGGGYAPASSTGTALAQLTFVWGSHPVEPWWINR